MQAAFLNNGALRHLRFRGLWSGGSVYFVGNAMQTMAASWMMVELSGSSFLAALVQTAVFLPMFLFSLPAGVLADITDRRRLILFALSVQVAAGALLATLSLTQSVGPGGVLFLIFVAGSCTALMSPAWNSTVAESVPREELPRPSSPPACPTTVRGRWARRLPAWCSPMWGAHGISLWRWSAR